MVDGEGDEDQDEDEDDHRGPLRYGARTDAGALGAKTGSLALPLPVILEEQVEERRRELARMRELMFRAEQVSKIKNKSYRRVAREEKDKQKQKMADSGGCGGAARVIGADKVTAPKANKKAIPAQQQKQVASSSSSSTAAAQKKDTENPWLNAGVSASTSAKRKDRNPSKSKQRAMELAEDARVDLLDEDLLDSGDVSKATTTSATATTSRGKAKATDDSGPSSSRGIAFTQRDLVAEAFAGDDVTIPTEPVAQRLLHCEAASVAERQNMLALSFRLDFRRSSIVSRFGFPRYCMLHTYAAAGTGSSDSQTSRLHT